MDTGNSKAIMNNEIKIEKFNFATTGKKMNRISAALRTLKAGEAIRLKTAADGLTLGGRMFYIGKERKVKFGSRLDGDDVLVFIKP